MRLFRVLLGALLGVISTSFADGNFPTPVPLGTENDAPYKYTGIVESDLGSGWLFGSGSAAIHPKFVIGCAHVNYDESKPGWLSDNYWYWKWNGVGDPPGPGLLLDGQAHFKSYGNLVKDKTYGEVNPKACNVDFVVNYSTSDTAGGECADWIERGDLYLQKSLPKFITGYPVVLYESGDADEFRLHETGPFNLPFILASRSNVYPGLYLDGAFPNYMGVAGVYAGKGNSGGPVWGRKNGEWALAGVLITTAYPAPLVGVYGIGQDSWSRITRALRSSEVGGALAGQLSMNYALPGVPARILDANPAPQTIQKQFQVTGMVGLVDGLAIDLVVNHSRQADLRVQLRSPSGVTVSLWEAGSRRGASKKNIVLSGKAIAAFQGQPANGTWVLSVKDLYPGNSGSLVSANFSITTR